MKTYSYIATFDPAEGSGVFTVTFPDVPEAITEGEGMAEARANAADALGVVLLTYLELDRPLPKHMTNIKANARDCFEIAPEPLQVAKIAVIETFRDAGITRTELARRMGKDEKEARRVLDPAAKSKIDSINLALSAMGRILVVGLEEAA